MLGANLGIQRLLIFKPKCLGAPILPLFKPKIAEIYLKKVKSIDRKV